MPGGFGISWTNKGNLRSSPVLKHLVLPNINPFFTIG